MNRNTFKSMTIVMVIFFIPSLLLSGCGFKLRGSGFESLESQTVFLLSENPYGALERNIRKKLSLYSMNVTNSSLVVEGSTSISDKESEQSGIRIIDIKTNKVPISVDVNGRPVEYETVMSVNVNFYFKDRHYQDKQEQQNHFSVRRDYQYSSNNNNLAHDKELELLTSEMANELSQRIVEQFLRQLTDYRSEAQ